MDAAGNIWPQNGNKMQICNPSIAEPDSWALVELANNIKYHRWSLHTHARTQKHPTSFSKSFSAENFEDAIFCDCYCCSYPGAGGDREIVKVDRTRWVCPSCFHHNCLSVFLFAREASCLFALTSLCLHKWEWLYYFWARMLQSMNRRF